MSLPISLRKVLTKQILSTTHTEISTVICDFSHNSFSNTTKIIASTERLYNTSETCQGELSGFAIGY